MPAHFDLRQLRYFVAVAEERSFRRAAERLHLSQPPLSRQIRELEDAFGATLFVRGRDGVSPTRAGEALLPRAAALLAEADGLVDAVTGAGRGAAACVGVTVAVQPQRLARLESAWRREVPGLVLRSGHSPELVAQLRAGQLAFALVALPADVHGLEVQVVDDEALVAAIPRAHPAARRRIVSLLDLADLPLFWWPRSHNPAYFDLARRVFREIGYRPRFVTVEPGQFLTLERIGRGEGFTLVNARRERIALAGVAYRRLKESQPLAIRVAAAWTPGTADDGRFRALARIGASVLRA
jgi:DNA-binding transcriptional LysR family regulator